MFTNNQETPSPFPQYMRSTQAGRPHSDVWKHFSKIQREQGLIQEISSSIKDLNCDNSEISANNVRPNCDNSEITRDFETQDIICLYQNACVAEKDAIEANQSEISCWCLYAKRFKGMVKDFMINDEIGEKKVKGRVYDFIIKQVPGIKHGNLCKQTQKALKIYNLFEKIGINKIQHIKTYSADTISRFTNLQIQTIIDHFAKKPDIEYTDDQNDSDDLPKIEVSIPTESIPLDPKGHDSKNCLTTALQ
ncbi:2796_t:CDS:2 [Entrophospora sp. SA101]|nr:2548_t:CDS:2 [Entrophospora sp. SA101]CAJ0752980.1 2796_t:CDS:2 [Entrophospora sp. SA101]